MASAEVAVDPFDSPVAPFEVAVTTPTDLVTDPVATDPVEPSMEDVYRKFVHDAVGLIKTWLVYEFVADTSSGADVRVVLTNLEGMLKIFEENQFTLEKMIEGYSTDIEARGLPSEGLDPVLCYHSAEWGDRGAEFTLCAFAWDRPERQIQIDSVMGWPELAVLPTGEGYPRIHLTYPTTNDFTYRACVTISDVPVLLHVHHS